MTIQKIATALCADSAESADKGILTDETWCEDFSASVEDAWKQVRALKRQRQELDQIFPAKKCQHEREFSEQVMNLAAQLHEQIYAMTP